MRGPEPTPAVDETRQADGTTSAAREAPATETADAGQDLNAALDEARAKASEHYDLYLRARAESENTRRRAQDDISRAHKFAVESFAEALVPVVDSLEKALETPSATTETLREGVELTLRQLRGAFEKNRLTEINPQGEKFDPHRHQAVSTVPADTVPAGHVAVVLQKGWMIADRVLRPALVTVAQG
jgi:molecular chaperone GrpE